MRKIALQILFCLLFPSIVLAASCEEYTAGNWYPGSYAAQSLAVADIQACLDDASLTGGDTIHLKTGSATWASAITVTRGVNIIGNGSANTIITSGLTASTSGFDANNYLVVYTPSAAAIAATETFRFNGIKLDLDGKCGGIAITGTDTTTWMQIQIDNNIFANTNGSPNNPRDIVVKGAFKGVINWNTFTNSLTAFNSYGRDGDSWALAYAFSSANNIYFENNIVAAKNSPIAGGQGGRYVARYNTFTYTGTTGLYPWFDMHGNQTGGTYALMGAEIYNNILTSTASNPNVGIFDQRGGKAIIHDNIVITSGSATAKAREDCADGVSPGSFAYSQHVTGSYYWNNKYGANLGAATNTVAAILDDSCTTTACSNETPVSCSVGDCGASTCPCYTLAENTDFFNTSTTYTPYTFPHPLDTAHNGWILKTADCVGADCLTEGTPTNYTATPSGTNCTISETAKAVASGATTTFTFTGDYGYSPSGGGTCGGSLGGSTWTTAAVTADCTVVCTGQPHFGTLGGSGTVTLGGSGTATLGK